MDPHAAVHMTSSTILLINPDQDTEARASSSLLDLQMCLSLREIKPGSVARDEDAALVDEAPAAIPKSCCFLCSQTLTYQDLPPLNPKPRTVISVGL